MIKIGRLFENWFNIGYEALKYEYMSRLLHYELLDKISIRGNCIYNNEGQLLGRIGCMPDDMFFEPTEAMDSWLYNIAPLIYKEQEDEDIIEVISDEQEDEDDIEVNSVDKKDAWKSIQITEEDIKDASRIVSCVRLEYLYGYKYRLSYHISSAGIENVFLRSILDKRGDKCSITEQDEMFFDDFDLGEEIKDNTKYNQVNILDRPDLLFMRCIDYETYLQMKKNNDVTKQQMKFFSLVILLNRIRDGHNLLINKQHIPELADDIILYLINEEYIRYEYRLMNLGKTELLSLLVVFSLEYPENLCRKKANLIEFILANVEPRYLLRYIVQNYKKEIIIYITEKSRTILAHNDRILSWRAKEYLKYFIIKNYDGTISYNEFLEYYYYSYSTYFGLSCLVCDSSLQHSIFRLFLYLNGNLCSAFFITIFWKFGHEKDRKKQITGISRMVKRFYRNKIEYQDDIFRLSEGIHRSKIDNYVDKLYERDDFVFHVYERSEFKNICYKIFEDKSIKLRDLKKMASEKQIELVLKLIDDKMQIVGAQ